MHNTLFPGPGTYDGANVVNEQIFAKFYRLSPKSFPKQRRLNPFPPLNPDVPGPGNYGYTSEFSIYASKKAPLSDHSIKTRSGSKETKK